VEDLKPERQTEIEAGIDASLASGFGLLEGYMIQISETKRLRRTREGGIW
jgi:hypothetical protein